MPEPMKNPKSLGYQPMSQGPGRTQMDEDYTRRRKHLELSEQLNCTTKKLTYASGVFKLHIPKKVIRNVWPDIVKGLDTEYLILTEAHDYFVVGLDSDHGAGIIEHLLPHIERRFAERIKKVYEHGHQLQAAVFEDKDELLNVRQRLQQLSEFLVTEDFHPLTRKLFETPVDWMRRMTREIPAWWMMREITTGLLQLGTVPVTVVYKDIIIDVKSYIDSLSNQRKRQNFRAAIERLESNCAKIRKLTSANEEEIYSIGLRTTTV